MEPNPQSASLACGNCHNRVGIVVSGIDSRIPNKMTVFEDVQSAVTTDPKSSRLVFMDGVDGIIR